MTGRTTMKRTPGPSVSTRQQGQQGMALVVTLWVLTLLSLVAAAFMADTRTASKVAGNLVENAKAEALADAGVYRAIAGLLDPNPARRPRVDGATYRWIFGGGEILISIQDEAGKIDLNRASNQLMEGLFLSVGTEPEAAKKLVQGIRDFADEDNVTNSDGAEDDEYRAAELLDGAKDAPFDSVAELQQVLGMNLDLYDRVAPVLTVYSGSRSLNPTTAPREALLALPGATHEQVDAVIAARRPAGESGDRHSAGPRDEAATAEPDIGDEMAGVDLEAATNGGELRDNGVYSITAVASTPGGGTFARVAIVRLTDDPLQPYIFHEWHRSWTAASQAPADGEED